MNRTQGYGKNTVRINESQLRDMIAESVKKVLNEGKVRNNIPYREYFKNELDTAQKSVTDKYFGRFKQAYDNGSTESEVIDMIKSKPKEYYQDFINEFDDATHAVRKREEDAEAKQGRRAMIRSYSTTPRDNTPYNEEKYYNLPKGAVFAIKQCEQKLGVSLYVERAYLNNYGEAKTFVEYMTRTSSYADGPGEDYSNEIGEILEKAGFSFDNCYGGEPDERQWATYATYRWVW